MRVRVRDRVREQPSRILLTLTLTRLRVRERPSCVLLTLTLTRLRVRERPGCVLLCRGRVVVQLEELIALLLVLLGASGSRQRVIYISGALSGAANSTGLEVKKCRDAAQRDIGLLLVGTLELDVAAVSVQAEEQRAPGGGGTVPDAHALARRE